MLFNKANIMVTGGAGFIGCNFIRFLFTETDFEGCIVNVDKLTYAGNLINLADIDSSYGNKRYFFEHVDICDAISLQNIFKKYDISVVVHFAAESHVDRSIVNPENFVMTNVIGTLHLLNTALDFWHDRTDVRFHHVSTDEVYGSLSKTGFFTEQTPYNPRSPYSASKAASDHLVRAYQHTYGLPTTITNCSNNYGPYQFPEKLIPLMINNAIKHLPLPVYGDGSNIRDWLYVKDHCSAIWKVINKGRIGETYNVGGNSELSNIEVVQTICQILDEKIGFIDGKTPHSSLISFVQDRKGHDWRYAIDATKIKNELNWIPSVDFKQGIKHTVNWYLDNQAWIKSVTLLNPTLHM